MTSSEKNEANKKGVGQDNDSSFYDK